ncbi:MAG TPA: YifB family Mg chelatase-like AAA ATPase [Candidatus Dormibacteraeota bacterium]
MIACAISCATRGLAGVPVMVEVDVSNGLPGVTIVGLTDRAIQEARERVKPAIRNAGFAFPQRRVTVNLAPAEVHKEGTGFDLAIAVAILRAEDQSLLLDGIGFIGELALDASVRPVTGVLPMARCLAGAGIKRLIVAVDNASEAALADGLEVLGAPSLQACIEYLHGERPLGRAVRDASPEPILPEPDLGAVRGQAQAKRALEIAAAGGHNLLMTGPPGAGKTMLARTFPSLLPDLPYDAALEVAAIYSLRGTLRERPPTTLRPPFRAPHHSISRAGLVGGGTGLAQPGEISLAHNGVLFMDELCEFSRQHLEALRQPLEEHTVTIARARAAVTYPADFMLIAASNPCPCGHLGDARGCSCEPRQLTAYQARLSGPIKDRIDLVVSVPRQEYREIFDGTEEESSASVRIRVDAARTRRRERPSSSNGALTGREILAAARSTAPARRLLALSGERLHLSARAFFRVLRVARTIADLAGDDRVGEDALAEALHYRIEMAG